MKNLTLLIFALLFVQITTFSQPCLPEGITFFSQEEIDNFQTNYPNCTEIEGTVWVGGYDITNLNGLSVLTSIGGALYIQCFFLTSLTGLDNLTSIGGNLYIEESDALTNLTGLDNVTSIGGEWIYIGLNNGLTSLTGLEGLTSIVGALYIGGNTLTSLTGLDNVTSIGGYLRIGGNWNLSSLAGLDNLTSIGAYLSIVDNDALTSLSGLDNINAGTITDLTIKDNISLSTCEVQSICDYLVSPNGTIEIHNNAPGCNSPEEVEEACESVSVEKIFQEGYLSLYPNPAKQEVNIYTEDGKEVEEVSIYTLAGQRIMKDLPVNGIVDISGLQAGMYIVEVISDDSKIREKLIIR